MYLGVESRHRRGAIVKEEPWFVIKQWGYAINCAYKLSSKEEGLLVDIEKKK
jgi:hypothetical protein